MGGVAQTSNHHPCATRRSDGCWAIAELRIRRVAHTLNFSYATHEHVHHLFYQRVLFTAYPEFLSVADSGGSVPPVDYGHGAGEETGRRCAKISDE